MYIKVVINHVTLTCNVPLTLERRGGRVSFAVINGTVVSIFSAFFLPPTVGRREGGREGGREGREEGRERGRKEMMGHVTVSSYNLHVPENSISSKSDSGSDSSSSDCL